MNKIKMPSAYAALSAEEQRATCGGGELKDAADSFFGTLQVNDFSLGSGLISFSISFVPMLLFRMIGAGVQTGILLYNQVNHLMEQFVQDTASVILYMGKDQSVQK